MILGLPTSTLVFKSELPSADGAFLMDTGVECEGQGYTNCRRRQSIAIQSGWCYKCHLRWPLNKICIRRTQQDTYKTFFQQIYYGGNFCTAAFQHPFKAAVFWLISINQLASWSASAWKCNKIFAEKIQYWLEYYTSVNTPRFSCVSVIDIFMECYWGWQHKSSVDF